MRKPDNKLVRLLILNRKRIIHLRNLKKRRIKVRVGNLTGKSPVGQRATQKTSNNVLTELILSIPRGIAEESAKHIRLSIRRTNTKLGLINLLLTEMSERRPIVVHTALASPFLVDTLIVIRLRNNRHDAKKETMLLGTIGTLIRTTDTKTTASHISLRTGLIGRRSLENLTDINIGHAAAEILGTLKTGIGTTNMEMTHDSFNIARASTGRNLVKTLQSDRTTEVIDRSGNDRTARSGKAGSIHQIGMILLDRELIANGTRNTNTSRIAKTDVKIRSKDRRRRSNRTSTLILNHEFQRTVSLNRTTFADNRQLHIRATLWSGQGGGKVIFEPTTRKKVTEKT